jgi:UDP-2,4-diacetamido-2,4,6-trideoxy-beta-L-altropyranose hydrolase
MTENHLLVRADGGAGIGAGHLMRCLALAVEYQSYGGRVVFLSHCQSPSLRDLIRSNGIELVTIDQPYPDPTDLESSLSAIERISKQRAASSVWIVVDGYHLDAGYQIAVKGVGPSVLVIDDYAHLPRYEADIILNQNIAGPGLVYDCPKRTQFLLGTRYCLLRSGFLEWKKWTRQVKGTAKNILVTLGAADSDNVTSKVIRALQLISRPELEARVVVGPSNPHIAELSALVSPGRTNIELRSNVRDMPALMAWADIAVSAAGSTCWELAFMQVPTITITTAENQSLAARTLHESGFAEVLVGMNRWRSLF